MGAVVVLPPDVANAAAGAPATITLADGQALPSWIRYPADDNTLVLGAVTDGAFPIQLVLQLADQRSALPISEEAAR